MIAHVARQSGDGLPQPGKSAEAKRILRLIRYALSGAIVGVAIAGITARFLGYAEVDASDVVGASLGFAAVIIFKMLHVF